MPSSIGKPGGGGGIGGGGMSPWAIDNKATKENKIEANIFLFCIISNSAVKVKKKPS